MIRSLIISLLLLAACSPPAQTKQNQVTSPKEADVEKLERWVQDLRAKEALSASRADQAEAELSEVYARLCGQRDQVLIVREGTGPDQAKQKADAWIEERCAARGLDKPVPASSNE